MSTDGHNTEYVSKSNYHRLQADIFIDSRNNLYKLPKSEHLEQ